MVQAQAGMPRNVSLCRGPQSPAPCNPGLGLHWGSSLSCPIRGRAAFSWAFLTFSRGMSADSRIEF